VSTSLVIPCAGSGSRLGVNVPKALVRVNGSTSMIDFILQKVNECFSEVVLVINPKDEAYFVNWLRVSSISLRKKIKLAYQDIPRGSFEASIIGLNQTKTNHAVIIWGDQIGILPSTVEHVIQKLKSGVDFMVPMTLKARPYVWLNCSLDFSKIKSVGRSRDGDKKPWISFADLGCFGFSNNAISHLEIIHSFHIERKEREPDLLYGFPLLSENVSTALSIVRNRGQTLAVNTPSELSLAIKKFS
jgi:CTP:molybdopterin cytidylyltransferase MocA